MPTLPLPSILIRSILAVPKTTTSPLPPPTTPRPFYVAAPKARGAPRPGRSDRQPAEGRVGPDDTVVRYVDPAGGIAGTERLQRDTGIIVILGIQTGYRSCSGRGVLHRGVRTRVLVLLDFEKEVRSRIPDADVAGRIDGKPGISLDGRGADLELIAVGIVDAHREGVRSLGELETDDGVEVAGVRIGDLERRVGGAR